MSSIQIGVRVPAASLATIDSKQAKTFYHAVPGANFIMPDGRIIVFLGGRFTTTEHAIIAELSAICDRPESQVYTKTSTAAAIDSQAKLVAEDAAKEAKSS